MKTKSAIYFSSAALVLLFILTGMDKVVNFREFRESMSGQVFTPAMRGVLIYLIPAAEMTCVVLLLFPASRLAGFACSSLLMALFTGYVVLVVLQVFAKHPCPCGGPLKHLSWGGHLAFNIIFLLTAIIGLISTFKERRPENQ